MLFRLLLATLNILRFFVVRINYFVVSVVVVFLWVVCFVSLSHSLFLSRYASNFCMARFMYSVVSLR